MNEFLNSRRRLLKLISWSPLVALGGCSLLTSEKSKVPIIHSLRNLNEFEKYACEGLDHEACDFLNGGADDLYTVKANCEAYREIELVYNTLVDVSTVHTEVTLFNEQLTSPIILSPVGLNQFFYETGELAVAQAAKQMGNMMIASHMTSYSYEEICSAYGRAPWFQLYLSDDVGYNQEMISRVEAAGCTTIFLTVDVPVGGNREGHEAFLNRVSRSSKIHFGNFPSGLRNTVVSSLTWKDVDWLRNHTACQVVLKGITSSHDAKLALEHQVDGIMVSNHGGRQLETNRGTIECLPEIKDAVGDELPILIDGGIRRGTDVIKALSLGAHAVAIGRPFVWGLALYGVEGVARVLEILQQELIRDMKLLGVKSLSEIDQSFVRLT